MDAAQRRLERYSTSPRLDAEVLLSFVCRRNRSYLFVYPEQTLTAGQIKQYTKLVEHRRRRTPIPYLTGSTTFFHTEIRVTPNVLVPRPFTEILLQHFFDRVTTIPGVIVDVGTGSGAIAIACAKRFPKSTILATDNSRAALSVARSNIRRLHLPNITTLFGNLLQPVRYLQPEIVIANLPYLTPAKLREPSIRAEPRHALDGGKDGLRDIRSLLLQAREIPTISTIILELDPAQVQQTLRLLHGWSPQCRYQRISDGRSIRGILAERT